MKGKMTILPTPEEEKQHFDNIKRRLKGDDANYFRVYYIDDVGELRHLLDDVFDDY